MTMADLPWLLYVAASVAVIAAPGQDMILVMSRGMALGRRAGVITATGISTGLVCHSIIATFGLGAILVASDLAYTILKYVGAAYLAYLGLRLIFSNERRLDVAAARQASLSRLFIEGALSNMSNPKVVLFYFAFLPQFIPPEIAQPALTAFVLGFTFAALTFLIKGPVGYFSGKLSAWLRARPNVLAWIYRTSGIVFLGLGVRLLFEER